MSEQQKPLYVRVASAQAYFGIHRATFYRWANAGRIKIYKQGPISLLKVAEVEAFLEGESEPSHGGLA
ncbi:MAG: helix-turn-helix domain-containing protein [Rhodobacteraceae bacterium]|nr:helix-turn-helix domain-containing protein [Paracoccaceae bacterium]